MSLNGFSANICCKMTHSESKVSNQNYPGPFLDRGAFVIGDGKRAQDIFRGPKIWNRPRPKIQAPTKHEIFASSLAFMVISLSSVLVNFSISFCYTVTFVATSPKRITPCPRKTTKTHAFKLIPRNIWSSWAILYFTRNVYRSVNFGSPSRSACLTHFLRILRHMAAQRTHTSARA